MDKKVIWDDTIAIIRLFQAEFVKCVKETVALGTFTRWLTVMNRDMMGIKDITGQYVDVLNIDYINMIKEKRLKNLYSMARRIAQFESDNDHKEIREVVTEAAREDHCIPEMVRLEGVEYPVEFEW